VVTACPVLLAVNRLQFVPSGIGVLPEQCEFMARARHIECRGVQARGGWSAAFLERFHEEFAMRKLAIALVSTLSVALAATAAGTLMSGPRVGEKVPGPFHVLNVNGPTAGEKACLYCRNGTNPVAMIFARESSEPLTTLIKKIDQATTAHSDDKMGSFVVFLNEKEGLDKQLKEFADREQLKSTVLAIDKPEGPSKYKLAPEADVTVVLYTDHTVKSNRAFAKGELGEKDIDEIMADLPKIFEKR
jgi:hypothetical protein